MTQTIVGNRYGKLLVINLAGFEKISYSYRSVNHSIWRCKCDCGKYTEVRRNNLVSGNTRSCGCLIEEKNQKLKGKGIQSNILPLGEAALNAFIGTYKYRAKKKSIEFKLTNEEFKSLIYQSCYFCGQPPDRQFPTKKKLSTCPTNGTILVNGIDRIDSSVGYTKNNCLPCCEICNKAKRDLSMSEFADWIKRIKNHNLSLGIVTT